MRCGRERRGKQQNIVELGGANSEESRKADHEKSENAKNGVGHAAPYQRTLASVDPSPVQAYGKNHQRQVQRHMQMGDTEEQVRQENGLPGLVFVGEEHLKRRLDSAAREAASNLKCNTPFRVRCTDADQNDLPPASA